MNFAKFLRTPFLTEHLRWLLLCIFASVQFSLAETVTFTSDIYFDFLYIINVSFIGILLAVTMIALFGWSLLELLGSHW